MLKQIFGLLLIIGSTTVYSAGIDIGLSNTTARFTYLTESGSLGYSGADVGYGFFYNEKGDKFANATILVVGNAVGAKRAIQYGFGAKANYGLLSATDKIAVAVSIGGTLRYLFPSQNPIGLTIEAFSSPRITSFNGTQNILETGARIDIEVMPNTRGYLGYRVTKIDHDSSLKKLVIENSVVFGVRLSF